MTEADDEKEEEKAPCCEYAKAETGFGEFELSVRECSGSTCAYSIFSDPAIYVKCPQRIKNQKEGVAATASTPPEPKKVFVRVHSKHESVPKFTGIGCNGCQFKASSYCWGQCTMNVWKRKSDW
jgi:hypothetical protein